MKRKLAFLSTILMSVFAALGSLSDAEIRTLLEKGRPRRNSDTIAMALVSQLRDIHDDPAAVSLVVFQPFRALSSAVSAYRDEFERERLLLQKFTAVHPEVVAQKRKIADIWRRSEDIAGKIVARADSPLVNGGRIDEMLDAMAQDIWMFELLASKLPCGINDQLNNSYDNYVDAYFQIQRMSDVYTAAHPEMKTAKNRVKTAKREFEDILRIAAQRERLNANGARSQYVQPEPTKPKFSITKFEHVDTDNDFSYSFEVAVNGNASPSEFTEMQVSFFNKLKELYRSQHPAVDTDTLVVDAKPSLSNGKYVGVVRMLTIHIEALNYDSTTRRGMIAVRFGTGQERFARDWVKRVIMEPLVKDKNILLTTGGKPPPGKYCSLGEKIVGNILEMEFKTE